MQINFLGIDSLKGQKSLLLSGVRISKDGVISYEVVSPGVKYQKFVIKVPNHKKPIINPDVLYEDMPEVEVIGFRGVVSGGQNYNLFIDFVADDLEVL